MKRKLFAQVATLAATLAAAAAPMGAAQAADVGVSISIGQPGFYGQIDLGNAPRPQLVYENPVIITRAGPPMPPLYLVVPPGYQRNWGRYCGAYHACGRQVYFVRQDWYDRVYVPHYRDHYYGGGWHDVRRMDRDRDGVPDYRDRDHGQGWANGHRDDRRDDRRDDHDRGRGHDRDHDRGHDRDHDRDHDHR